MKDLLNRARLEVIELRRRVEILQAKVEVMDLFACVLHTTPAARNDGAMAPDVAWLLQKEIDRLNEAEQQAES